MYGNTAQPAPTQLAGSANTPSRPPIHGMSGELTGRLYQATAQLDKILARLRGAQPVPPEQNGKADREPSTSEHVQTGLCLIAHLEDQLSELGNIIG